ncbi:hypothetical protein PAXINDRAFT_173147, partial [Paxillus involutus ATCC 200175]
MGQVVAKNGGGGSVCDPWTMYILAGVASVPREENETARAGDSDTDFVLVPEVFG